MSVQEPLVRLLAAMVPGVEILGGDEAPAAFDFHAPLMSLPLAFATRLESLPSRPRYVTADTDLQALWARRLGPKTRPRIGLAWSGAPGHKNDRNRSIALGRLGPVLARDADWVSLQKELRAGEAETLGRLGRPTHFGGELTDFADTAALVDQLDLVICVDTSLAHLAGAMGKPVWILPPFNCDWRWLTDRNDSPWYPSARLYRQPRLGDWTPVIEQVAADLGAWLGSGPFFGSL